MDYGWYINYLEAENERLKREKQQYFTVLALILSKMPNKEVMISHKLLMTFDPSLYKIEQTEDYLTEVTVLKLKELKMMGKKVTSINDYKNSVDEYEKALERAKEDYKIVVKSTEEMIDMHFYDFARFLEGKNVGELYAFRALLQTHLDRADIMAKSLVETMVTTFQTHERVQMGSVFSIIAKIVDRIGYIDYLIQKNSID